MNNYITLGLNSFRHSTGKLNDYDIGKTDYSTVSSRKS